MLGKKMRIVSTQNQRISREKEEKEGDLACGDLDAQTMHEEMKIR